MLSVWSRGIAADELEVFKVGYVWVKSDIIKCVDPDSLRFAQKESDGVWQFCQITNILINSIFEGNPEGLIAAYKHNKIVNGVDVFVELNKSYSMISSTVNLVDEDKSTLEEYKKEFGSASKEDLEYLCCEHIFLEDSEESFAENLFEQNFM